MKKLIVLCFIAFASSSIYGDPATDFNKSFTGVYLSKGDSPQDGALILNDDGKGMFDYFTPFLWKAGPGSNEFTLTGSFEGKRNISNSVAVRYEPQKKAIEVKIGQLLQHTYHLTTNEVRKEWMHNLLRHFDGTQHSFDHGGFYTIAAICVSNHVADLEEAQKLLFDKGVLRRSEQRMVLIDSRDVDLANSYLTNVAKQKSLTLHIRKSADTNLFELWELGNKTGEEQYENGKQVPNWMR